MRKSSGLPNVPKRRKSLGTSELEKMHVLNHIYPSRKLQKIIAFVGWPMPKSRWKTSQGTQNLLLMCSQMLGGNWGGREEGGGDGSGEGERGKE